MCETIGFQPPVSHTIGSVGSKESSDINPHVKDHKSGIPQLRIFRIIIHLSYDGLQVPLEEPVSKGNYHQPNYSYRQCHAGYCHDNIAGEHDNYTGKDYKLILLCSISQDPAKQCKGIYAEIEPAVYSSGFFS